MWPPLADTDEVAKEEELRAQSTCERLTGSMWQTTPLCRPETKAWADRYNKLYKELIDKRFNSISNLINGGLLASKENCVYKFQIPVVRVTGCAWEAQRDPSTGGPIAEYHVNMLAYPAWQRKLLGDMANLTATRVRC